MPISYNTPTLNTIKDFTNPKSYDDWLPGLFDEAYYNGTFPINYTGNLTEQTEFSKKNSDIDDFTISLKRYYLFLYCLKSRPFLFESASKLLSYNKDEFLFTPELAEYLSNVQTNKIKNQINSSLTIELVKKYAIDKGLDFIPQKLSDFFDIAKSEDYINTISRTLNNITYESVVKHTLYENLKTTSFKFKQGSANGWTDRAINIPSGKFEYFIDVEGGPDNKSYPVVCVLTKRLNKDLKEDILSESNSYISSIFAKKVGNECLARVIGKPGQFENNYKVLPILKGRKDDNFFYNSVCIVYDLSKIILSSSEVRNYDLQSLIEIGLGFFTEYTVEINNIDELTSRSEYFSNFMSNYFSEDSLSGISYKISAKNKHLNEIYSRINLFSKEEVSKTLSNPIAINRANIVNAFSSYVQLIINSYKQARSESQYLIPFSQEDVNVYIHFDSFLNLLAITTLPKQKKQTEVTKEFTPFVIEDFNKFDLDNEKKYLSEQFYGSYLNLVDDIKNYSGRRVCIISKTLERILYNTVDEPKAGFYKTKNLTSDDFVKQDLDLLLKIKSTLPESNFDYQKEDFFIEESLIDKTVKIANLNTTYRENKYQSVALQTLAFYLINAQNGLNLLGSETDVKKFGEVYHYPILSTEANEEQRDLSISLDLEEIINKNVLEKFPDVDFDVPQEILIISSKVNAAFDQILSSNFTLESIANDAVDNILSNIPCYADIINIFQSFASAETGRDYVIAIMSVLDRLPIAEMISALLEFLLNKLQDVLETAPDPCKPLPSKFSFNPDDLFKSLEYLKDIYSRTLDPLGLIQGILSNIPKLSTLDFWLSLLEKIALFLLKIAIDFILNEIFIIVKPTLEKWCALDFEIFRPPFLEENSLEALSFSPNILADSFGQPAGSGGALYDVQLTIDINVLIDISLITTKEFVYEKFCEEFSIQKSEENFLEISKFFSYLSPSVDLYELAALLRGTATEYTLNTVLDSIKISDFSYKKLFAETDDVSTLFIFLSKYCDYRICYDLLSRSLEKYAGNICGPQQSRKGDYELILKNAVGDNFKNVLRDQIIDLEKQFDKACSNDLTVGIDLFKNGPKLLANSLTPYMVMSFSTIVDFQKNLYDYERGLNLTPAQKDLLGSTIFKESDLNTVLPKYTNSIGSISSKYFQIFINEKEILTNESLLIISKGLKSSSYLKDFNLRKNEIKSYLNTKNIQIEEFLIDDKVRSELIINPILKASEIYDSLVNNKIFQDVYTNIVYGVNYLEDLKNEITEQIENATNLDMQDDMELFNSYISKLKEIS